jgi:two-component system sensor histidine kinase TtrS
MGTKSKMPSQEQIKEAVSDYQPSFDDVFNDNSFFQHTIDIIIITDLEGTIKKVNKQTGKLFNYTHKELIGQKIEQLIPERFQHKHIKKRKGYVSSPSIRPMGIGLELWACRKDGTEFPCEVSLSPFKIANDKFIICNLRDITDRKQAEILLKKSDERNRLLLNSTAEAIFGLDLNGNCTFCNPACLSMLGYENQNDMLGKNAHKMMHHTRADGSPYPVEDCQIYKAFINNTKCHVDTEVLFRKDGSSFPSEYWSHPIRFEGETIGCVVTFLDITHRKQAEAEVKTQRENIAHLVRVQTLGEMAAGIAHEINQPLAAINSYAEASGRHLQSEKVNFDKVVELIGKISDQARRAGSIVSRLRAMMQNKISKPVALDINILVGEAAEIAEIGAKDNNCSLIFKYSSSLPRVICDGVQIQQVTINLISNAIEAMDDIADDVEKNVNVETMIKDDDYVEVCISDNGSGIDDRDGGNIFEAFYTTKDSGLGMGLSICKSIIENHGGELGYSQNETGGSKFCFSLPVEKSEKSII